METKKTYVKTLGAIISKRKDDYYIVNKNSVYKVNEIGARIFELCKSNNSCEIIVENMMKVFTVDKEEIQNDVEEYLELLIEYSLVKVR